MWTISLSLRWKRCLDANIDKNSKQHNLQAAKRHSHSLSLSLTHEVKKAAKCEKANERSEDFGCVYIMYAPKEREKERGHQNNDDNVDSLAK